MGRSPTPSAHGAGRPARWRQEGRDVQASVNVGAEVLAAGAFLPTLQRRLREQACRRARLCLELTESEVLSPEGPTLLAQVRATGMTVALDDFGTGYSSLSYLADLPLDRLKLDRSFVRRLSATPAWRASWPGSSVWCTGLGLPVIAEGVEQQDEADVLDELGWPTSRASCTAGPVRAHALPSPGPADDRQGVRTTFRHSSCLCLNSSYIRGASDERRRWVMMKLGSISPRSMRSSSWCW
jgi:EAL domain-containing protein (putative c-di-GMP-specific phosphodiesterase class I)